MLTYDLDKRGNKTMYEYLYELIKEDIADGKLKADEKLPSKRGLSQHLQISVKTVENAYEQLLLEGYIRSEEKRGYYVNKIAVVTGGAPGYAAPVKRFQEETYLADLTANNIRYDRFPFATWAKVMRETLTDYNTSLLKTVPFNGVLQLREAIADHLNRYRGMQVSADHIIIGAGTEYLYNRLLQLLGPDVKFGVENPGYRKITKIYDENGVDWDYVNIDDKGMKVDELRMKDINVAHVSPEHHFPIGLVMPVARRQELLNWAAEEPGRYIIEDDFDCEFRMQGKPIPSIQSRDRSHRVIYMNTFSKTMVPSLRIGYMVLPEKLMEKYISTMNFYSCTVSGFEQYAMAAFIEKGYFERHIKRLVNDYRGRREKICRMFRESRLNEISTIYQDDAGTHFLLHVKTSLSDVEIKWAVRQKGILINCLSEYCFADADKYHGILVIHYSDMDEATLKLVIAALRKYSCKNVMQSMNSIIKYMKKGIP